MNDDFGLAPEYKRPQRQKKKKTANSGKSPTQKTLKLLRDQGYLTCVTEYWMAHAQRRKDLYGFIDIVCLDLNLKVKGILGVQTTSKSGLSARIKKAKGKDAFWIWLATGNRVEFHGWDGEDVRIIEFSSQFNKFADLFL